MKKILRSIIYNIILKRIIKETYNINKKTNNMIINNNMSNMIKRSNILYSNTLINKHTISPSIGRNNRSIINKMYIDNIVINIINIIYNNIIKGINIEIIHSQPKFIHNINNVKILVFIYIPKNVNNYNNNMIQRILNNMTELEVLLSNKNYYNKTVNINTIILKYNYIDSNIYSNTINNVIRKYNIYKGKYSSIQNKNILLSNNTLILIHKYNTINMLSMYIYKQYIYNILTNTNNNNIYINNIIRYLMINQYIIGYNMLYIGKRALSDSNARSISYNKSVGSFNTSHIANISNNNTYSYGIHKYNISISNNANININGLFNVKVKLAHL